MLRGTDWSDNNALPSVFYVNDLHVGGEFFAIVKATGGEWYDTKNLASYVFALRNGGLRVAFYHFAFERLAASFGAVQALAEFRKFRDAISHLWLPGDAFALDMEDKYVPASYDLAPYVREFTGRAWETYGAPVYVYGSPSYLREHNIVSCLSLPTVRLWLASWHKERSDTPIVDTLDGYPVTIWQWDDGAGNPDSDGTAIQKVDRNIFLGSPADWDANAAPYPPLPAFRKLPTDGFPTGVAVDEAFYTEWETPYGADGPLDPIAVFGYPVAPAEVGNIPDVQRFQYFERARLELRTDGSISYGRVGAELLGRR